MTIAKGKFQEWVTDDGLLLINGWARDGLTDAQIAEKIGIRRETLYCWMKQFPNISNTIKKGRAPIDVEVENALLKRAIGYDWEEKIEEITEYPDGTQIKHIKKTKRHVAGDVAAQIFWLKNRKADKWKDKRDSNEKAEDEPIKELLKRIDDECSVKSNVNSGGTAITVGT